MKKDYRENNSAEKLPAMTANIYCGLETKFPQKRLHILSHSDTCAEHVNGIMIPEEYKSFIKALSIARESQNSDIYLPFEISASISRFNDKVPYCDGSKDDEGNIHTEKQLGYKVLEVLIKASGNFWGYRYTVPVIKMDEDSFSLGEPTFSQWDENHPDKQISEEKQIELMSVVCEDLQARIDISDKIFEYRIA